MFNQAFFSTTIALFFFVAATSSADTRMIIHQNDFTSQAQLNTINFFGFEIIFDGNLQPGVVNNPPLLYVEYHIVASLGQPTPSGLHHFHLTRIMDGTEFYEQGSSLAFQIAQNADLTDGLQFNELVNGLVLDAVEIGTGQFHSPLVQLNVDGTGSIQNANNFGGINTETGLSVDVEVGEEYWADLPFDTESFVLSVPMPGDLNLDCEINLLDVHPFVEALINPEYDLAADVNGDGTDDLLDVAMFVELLL